MKSKEIRLVSRPVGMPDASNFEAAEVDVPEPAEGEVLVQNICMSVDPYMRGRMMDRESYIAPFQVGEALQGGAIGKVLKSRVEGISEGDYVDSMFGWREAFCAGSGDVNNLGQLSAPASAYLGVLGMPGLTAYVGLLEIGALKEGETVFVSGAAGAVGSIVGQIAKIKNCRVLGSAGSPVKVRDLVEDLGFDYAFDYHDGDLLAHLQEGAPDGIDVYFDNVGGDHLEAALAHMRPMGRITLCGAIAQYNDTEPAPGPNNLLMAVGLGLTLKGFIVFNYLHLKEDFIRDMSEWIESGQVKYRETVYQGIEKAPEAFLGLFTGANTGKMVVQLTGE
jgi:NADPH-dependent curcumin reductase CurA